MHISSQHLRDRAFSTHREWLECDGLGGYAAGSISGALTRRYHGLLCVPVASLRERHVLLSKLMPTLVLPTGERFELDLNLFSHGTSLTVAPQGDLFLERFWIDEAPRWEYRCGDATVLVSVVMPRGTAAVLVHYTVSGIPSATLELRPLYAARSIHRTAHENGALNQTAAWNEREATVTIKPYIGYPPFMIEAPSRTRWLAKPQWWRDFYLPRDAERGFDAREDLHSPGVLEIALEDNIPAVLRCTAQECGGWESPAQMFHTEIQRRKRVFGSVDGAGLLRRAAEQFLTRDDRGVPGVVAGYPWFDRWGRDTMISLAPLTGIIGAHEFEKEVLEQQLSLIREGLVPNLITEDGTALYNSIDAVLLLFVAVHRYRAASHDGAWVERIALPALREAAVALQRGTRFGVFVSSDGLLNAGVGDVQLTWMDAKVNGHPVTPRHGKPVEVNALWFNAVRILAELEVSSGAALSAHSLASQIQRSFLATFLKRDGSLQDVVPSAATGDGTEGEFRPNQLFAAALPFPLLDREQTARMLELVKERLVTDRGLRTLAPGELRYRSRYAGAPAERDSAYHQGTVWPWLFAPYAAALASIGAHDEIEHIREALTGMMADGCLGSIGEVYDGDAPRVVGGCFAQAWSVAAACALQIGPRRI